MLRFGRCIKYFNRNGLTFHKKGTFSETIDSTKQKTSQVAPEFNSYKDLPQIVRESQSNCMIWFLLFKKVYKLKKKPIGDA